MPLLQVSFDWPVCEAIKRDEIEHVNMGCFRFLSHGFRTHGSCFLMRPGVMAGALLDFRVYGDQISRVCISKSDRAADAPETWRRLFLVPTASKVLLAPNAE